MFARIRVLVRASSGKPESMRKLRFIGYESDGFSYCADRDFSAGGWMREGGDSARYARSGSHEAGQRRERLQAPGRDGGKRRRPGVRATGGRSAAEGSARGI